MTPNTSRLWQRRQHRRDQKDVQEARRVLKEEWDVLDEWMGEALALDA